MSKMNKEQIMETIRKLAESQGFYGRILRIIESSSEETREALLKGLEEQDLHDAIDLINYLEG